MILKIFTKEEGPEMREAKELGARLEDLGYEIEYFDSDDANATGQIELYDIYAYPAFVVARDDGSPLQSWRGKKPLESDLKQFLNQ